MSIGHDPAHLDDGVEVVVSSAIAADEPELLAARDRGLPRLHRAEVLAEMVASRRSLCVAGAHGKTTTAAMAAFAAQRLDLDPTYLIGGDVPQLGGNAGPGGGTLLVAEADESDGSLSLLRPRVAVITNIELDHHARFAGLDELRRLFAEWRASCPRRGRHPARVAGRPRQRRPSASDTARSSGRSARSRAAAADRLLAAHA